MSSSPCWGHIQLDHSPEGNIWLRLDYLQGWRIHRPGWPGPVFDQPYGERIFPRTWLEFLMLQFVSIASVTERLWEDSGSVFSSCPLGSQRQQLNGSWGLQLPQRHFCYARAQQERTGDAGGRLVLGDWYSDEEIWLGREQRCKRSCSYIQPCRSKKCTIPWICCLSGCNEIHAVCIFILQKLFVHEDHGWGERYLQTLTWLSYS